MLALRIPKAADTRANQAESSMSRQNLPEHQKPSNLPIQPAQKKYQAPIGNPAVQSQQVRPHFSQNLAGNAPANNSVGVRFTAQTYNAPPSQTNNMNNGTNSSQGTINAKAQSNYDLMSHNNPNIDNTVLSVNKPATTHNNQTERMLQYFDPLKDGELSPPPNYTSWNHSLEYLNMGENYKSDFQDNFALFENAKFEQQTDSSQGQKFIQKVSSSIGGGSATVGPSASTSPVENLPSNVRRQTMGHQPINLHEQSKILQNQNAQSVLNQHQQQHQNQQQQQQLQQQQFQHQSEKLRVQLPPRNGGGSFESSDDENVPGGQIGPTVFTNRSQNGQNSLEQPFNQLNLGHNFTGAGFIPMSPVHNGTPTSTAANSINVCANLYNVVEDPPAFDNSRFEPPQKTAMAQNAQQTRRPSAPNPNNNPLPGIYTSTKLLAETQTESTPLVNFKLFLHNYQYKN